VHEERLAGLQQRDLGAGQVMNPAGLDMRLERIA